MKYRGMCENDETSFSIERSALHQDTYLAQCLTCGGRGFMGLDCQKYLNGVYNLVLRFCYYCKVYGMLGANCMHCKTGKYQKISIKCLNPRYGTIYTCYDMTYNRYWYDAVQESFDKHNRQMNQIMRWNMES